MSTYGLKLRGQVIGPDSFKPVPPLPDNVWEYFSQAGHYVNYSLLLAESFGMDSSEALEILEDIWRIEAEISQIYEDYTAEFTAEDAAELAVFFEEVTNRLRAALDSHDRPANMDGQRLVKSDWVERDEYGVLRSRARGHTLGQILENMSHLTMMFRFAADNELWLVVE